MKIILIRHGKPDFLFRGNASSAEIGNLVKLFDGCGIIDEPPNEIKQLASIDNIIFCSNLSRSIESAKALKQCESYITNQVFKEVLLPYFDINKIKIPVKIWLVLFRLLSIFGFAKNGESLLMAKRRAKLAAEILIEAAKSHKVVLLIGHGFINRFIAKELLFNGWVGPAKTATNYWGHDVYTHNST